MGKRYGQPCGLAAALDKVGDRWVLLIVRELLTGPKRFTDLKRVLAGMASNLLTSRLRDLENDGLVVREPGALGPAAYRLTPRGRALEEPIRALWRWGASAGVTAEKQPVAGRPHWLLVAIPAALGDDAPESLHVDAGLEVDGFTLALRVRDGRIELRPDALVPPEAFRMKTDYRSFMAFLTGAVSLKALEAAGKARIDGPKLARARFETLVALGCMAAGSVRPQVLAEP